MQTGAALASLGVHERQLSHLRRGAPAAAKEDLKAQLQRVAQEASPVLDFYFQG